MMQIEEYRGYGVRDGNRDGDGALERGKNRCHKPSELDPCIMVSEKQRSALTCHRVPVEWTEAHLSSGHTEDFVRNTAEKAR